MKNLQLTDFEQKEIEAIVALLKSNYNKKSKAVKTDTLLFDLTLTTGTRISGQSLRRYLGIIRKHDLASPSFVVSNVNLGYWCTEDKEEMNSYLQQELNRMSNQFANVEALRQRLILNKPQVTHQQILMFNG